MNCEFIPHSGRALKRALQTRFFAAVSTSSHVESSASCSHHKKYADTEVVVRHGKPDLDQALASGVGCCVAV